jgi:opacity protein-like surface antigen
VKENEMRAKGSFVLVALAAIALAAPSAAQDADRSVKGGGIMAKGWQGKVDAGAAKQGKTIKDSRFEEKNGSFHISAGSASTYWNPANTATGDYTVSATFTEPKIAAGHPHPYGLFIGGSNLETDKPTYVYCVAYGDGTALVRGFSDGTVVNYSKRAPNAAVKKAEEGGSVTQSIAWTVKGDKAECTVNGSVVASFPKADLVGAGKLASTDGVYGIRAAHNVDIVVSNFAKK